MVRTNYKMCSPDYIIILWEWFPTQTHRERTQFNSVSRYKYNLVNRTYN